MQVGFDISGEESATDLSFGYTKALVVSQVSMLFEMREILEQLAKTEVKDEQLIDTLMYGLTKVSECLNEKTANSSRFIDASGANFSDFANRELFSAQNSMLYHQIDFSDAIFAERTRWYLIDEKFQKLSFTRCLFNKSMFFAFEFPALDNCTFRHCIFSASDFRAIGEKLYFLGCVFDQCTFGAFRNSVFSDCWFYNCLFSSGTITDSELSDGIFFACSFRNFIFDNTRNAFFYCNAEFDQKEVEQHDNFLNRNIPNLILEAMKINTKARDLKQLIPDLTEFSGSFEHRTRILEIKQDVFDWLLARKTWKRLPVLEQVENNLRDRYFIKFE